MNGSVRVVLDTNVLVSGIGYPGGTPGKILAQWRAGNLSLVVSQYILDETARVLPRLKSSNLERDDIESFIREMEMLAEMVVPVSTVEPGLRDAADRPVLGTLLASGAAYLITGDKDLLALAGKYPVVTPAEFWARHG